MSPSAVLQTTSELTVSGIKHTIEKTAPSTIANGHTKGTKSTVAELDASKLMFTRNTDPKVVPEPDSPEVWAQATCTDHMITAKWTLQSGWEAPHLQPYGPLSLMPTASVLHYATECFEGMKLYRGHDGLLRLFRPDLNTRRMLSSSTRISLPAFNPDALEALLIALCARDGEKWLPKSRPGSFLYLRPTMIGSGPGLGVQVPKEALLYIIITCFPAFDEPAGTVFVDPTNPANNENTDNNITNSSHANSTANGTSNGDTAAQETAQFPVSTRKPGLRLLASKEDTIRAWPNGFGCAKLGANYGPSLIAQAEARARGYDQILWLFGAHCEVTEAGASNFFVVWRTREGKLQLVTAPLEDKIILDGITRRSVLQLAREQLADGGKREESLTGLEGLECVERKYTMGEVCEAIEEGRLEEAFAAGTAYFISPINEIHFRGKDLEIPLSEGVTGTYARILKKWLKDIMYGNVQHPWGVVVDEKPEEY